jgi:chromatin remodeling complex protein RSC6
MGKKVNNEREKEGKNDRQGGREKVKDERSKRETGAVKGEEGRNRRKGKVNRLELSCALCVFSTQKIEYSNARPHSQSVMFTPGTHICMPPKE